MTHLSTPQDADGPGDGSPLAVLDDPVPFVAPPELVTRAKRRGSHLRRRRRLVWVSTALPVVLLAAVVAGAVYVDRRTDGVHRVTVADGELAPVTAGQPFNILVVGTDEPRGQAGARTDTIMVAHVDEAAGRVDLLSIPRDLVWSSSDPRIDTVLGTLGASALIDQLEQHLGISISHYVEIDEPGLVDLVDQLGGVRVASTTALRDMNSGLQLPAGCSQLDGDQALALVRARNLQQQDPRTGQWTFDPTGDLGREARQQEVVGIFGRRLLTLPIDGSTLPTLLDVFADHTTIDAGLSRSTLVDLVRWGHGLTPADLTTATVPVIPVVTVSGGDVLVLGNQAGAVVRSALGSTGSDPAPSQAPVLPVGAPAAITAC